MGWIASERLWIGIPLGFARGALTFRMFDMLNVREEGFFHDEMWLLLGQLVALSIASAVALVVAEVMRGDRSTWPA